MKISRKKYWYHISCTLTAKYVLFRPRTNDEGFHRNDSEPNTSRICVTPSLEQCLTAIPYGKNQKYSLYRTKKYEVAWEVSDREVFDASVTNEAWLLQPTMFVKVGVLDMKSILTPTGRPKKIREEAATDGDNDTSYFLLQWWKRVIPSNFLQKNA